MERKAEKEMEGRFFLPLLLFSISFLLSFWLCGSVALWLNSTIEYYHIAAMGVDDFSGRAAPQRDLPIVRAARIGEQIILIPCLGEISVESPDRVPSDMDLRLRRDFMWLQFSLGEIGDEVAEAIDVNNAAFDNFRSRVRA